MKRIIALILAAVAAVAVGQIPISNLPPATLPLTGTEKVPMVQSGSTRQASVNAIQSTSAPNTNPFVLQSAGVGVPNARVLAAGGGVSLTDGGPGGSLTVTATSPFPGFANPSASVGLSPVNGVSGLAMASDSAPALSQAISPTWTGNHTFSPVAGGTQFNGVAGVNSYAAFINAPNTANQSFGLRIQAGTNGADVPFRVQNAAAGPSIFQINGDGGGFAGTSTGLTWLSNGEVFIGPPSTGAALQVSGVAGSYAEFLSSPNTAGQSLGLLVSAGTNASDAAVTVQRKSGATLLNLAGDGSGTLGPSSTLGIQWGSGGAVTIPTPTSSTALTVNGASGAFAGKFNAFADTSSAALLVAGNGAGAGLFNTMEVTDPGNTNGVHIQLQGNGGVTPNKYVGTKSGVYEVLSDATTRIWSLSDAGTVTALNEIISPTSGVGLTVNAVAATNGIEVKAAAANAAVIAVAGNGQTTANGFQISDNGTSLVNFQNQGTITSSINTSNQWTWNAPTAGGQTGFTFHGRNGNNAMLIDTTAGSGTAFGLNTAAGTTSADYSFLAANQGNTTNFFEVRGDGAILGRGATAAALVDMTPDTGTFTATYTGFTAGVTCTASWSRVGQVVILNMCGTAGTSNATTFTITGVPAAIQPATLTNQFITCSNIIDSGANQAGAGLTVQNSTGTITLSKGPGQGVAFTNAGSKGISSSGCLMAYSLK